MKLQPLRQFESSRTKVLSSALRQLQYRNCFNPSIRSIRGTTYLTIRALGQEHTPPFIALLVVIEEGVLSEVIDLSRYAERFGIDSVADPKLFVTEGDLWLTFNTGYSRDQNEIYVQRLTPELGRPLRCLLSGRRRVEKNWAFYKASTGLAALYSVSPVVQVVETERSETEDFIRFEFLHSPTGERSPASGQSLSIGTQLAFDGGKAYLIAHEKVRIAKWRAYLGRFVTIYDVANDPTVAVSPRRLFHSYRSLLGPRRRFNPNMFSCTYFSGLEVSKGRAVMTYGINDVDWAVRETVLDAL